MSEKTAESKLLIREKLSKRIIGTILFICALIMGSILFTKSINTEIKDTATALTLIQYCLVAGGTLWGISMFDNLKIGIAKK